MDYLVLGGVAYRDGLHTVIHFQYIQMAVLLQGDSFGTRPKKMLVTQRLFITF